MRLFSTEASGSSAERDLLTTLFASLRLRVFAFKTFFHGLGVRVQQVS